MNKPKFNFGDTVKYEIGDHSGEFLVTHIKVMPQGTYAYSGEGGITSANWIHETDLTKVVPSKKFYLYVKADTGYVYTTMMDETGTTPGGKKVDTSNLIRLPFSVDLPFDVNAEKPQRKKKSSYYDDGEPEDD